MNLLTPPGTAGVAVVWFPPDERTAALSLLRPRSGLALASDCPRPVLADLWIGGRRIDEVLYVDRGPFGVEVHAHGAPAVWAKLSASAVRSPPRSHVPTWERVLQTAMSPEAVGVACEQSRFDFACELAAMAELPLDTARERVTACLHRSRTALAVVQPTVLVLAGRQNAGKSTLFNRLLLRDRVLVGPQPGLTRDMVAEAVALSGLLYEVVDTAGEGPASGDVDAVAIERGRRRRQDAMVVLVVPAGECLTPAEERMVASGALLVRSKGDLVGPDASPGQGVRLSAASGCPHSVRKVVGEALWRHRGITPAEALGGPAAIDAEQWHLLRDLAQRLGIEVGCGASGPSA